MTEWIDKLAGSLSKEDLALGTPARLQSHKDRFKIQTEGPDFFQRFSDRVRDLVEELDEKVGFAERFGDIFFYETDSGWSIETQTRQVTLTAELDVLGELDGIQIVLQDQRTRRPASSSDEDVWDWRFFVHDGQLVAQRQAIALGPEHLADFILQEVFVRLAA